MSVPWDIRHRGLGVPKDFWERDPVIEIFVLCSRCKGNFSDKEFKVERISYSDQPHRTVENCPNCDAGRQRLLVPLRSVFRSLSWRR